MRDLLTAAFQVVDDIRYHTELGDDSARALFYRGRCGGLPLEEAQLLRLGPDGLITELTLFGRPLPALTELMKRLGPVLLRRQGRPGLARVAAAAGGPPAAMARTGDERVVPLAAPDRSR